METQMEQKQRYIYEYGMETEDGHVDSFISFPANSLEEAEEYWLAHLNLLAEAGCYDIGGGLVNVLPETDSHDEEADHAQGN